MERDVTAKEISSQEIYVRFSLKKLCLMTVILPMSALVICFITANIFQRDDVHETHCRMSVENLIVNLTCDSCLPLWLLKVAGYDFPWFLVSYQYMIFAEVLREILFSCGSFVCILDMNQTKVYNIIPSISAITGISPQRYLWRICVALHIGPRLLVAIIYKDYYRGLLDKINPHGGNWLLGLCFWLSITEIVTLCGVTYVSNRENYPVHEKIFITFMISSLCYMLVTLKIHNLTKKTEQQEHSYRLKKLFFAASLLSTIGLFIFFIKHRFLCHDMAFSWFSTCEYLIAFFNMSFHMTVILDFPVEEILVGKGLEFSRIVGNGMSDSHKWKAE